AGADAVATAPPARGWQPPSPQESPKPYEGPRRFRERYPAGHQSGHIRAAGPQAGRELRSIHQAQGTTIHPISAKRASACGSGGGASKGPEAQSSVLTNTKDQNANCPLMPRGRLTPNHSAIPEIQSRDSTAKVAG